MVVKGMAWTSGDIVRVGATLAIVRTCVARGALFHVLVDPLAKEHKISARGWVCAARESLWFLDLAGHGVLRTRCWAWMAAGRVWVLLLTDMRNSCACGSCFQAKSDRCTIPTVNGADRFNNSQRGQPIQH